MNLCGEKVTVELKNGVQVEGEIEEVDFKMNVFMKDVVLTSNDRENPTSTHFDFLTVRGSTIIYVKFDDNLPLDLYLREAEHLSERPPPKRDGFGERRGGRARGRSRGRYCGDEHRGFGSGSRGTRGGYDYSRFSDTCNRDRSNSRYEDRYHSEYRESGNVVPGAYSEIYEYSVGSGYENRRGASISGIYRGGYGGDMSGGYGRGYGDISGGYGRGYGENRRGAYRGQCVQDRSYICEGEYDRDRPHGQNARSFDYGAGTSGWG